jgi:long-chain acyl-CoA synthetase
METLKSKMGWEIVEEEWPDFKGKIFKNRPKNVVELLEDTVKKYPDREGFICDNWRLTFKEFDGIVNRIAAGLEKQGVKRGDHVAVLLGIQLEFPLSFFALMKLGAIVVPLNTRFKGEELAYEINDSESKVLIVDEEYWPFIEFVRDKLKTIEKIFFNGPHVPDETLPFSLLRENKEDVFTRATLSESDDALIMYTSGTTGKPKGAVLHQRGLVLTAMLVSDFMFLKPGDKMIGCIPLFHITGLNQAMIASIFSGIPCVYMRTFKTKEFLEIMSSEKVTAYIGVINIIWLMVNHPDFDAYDFSNFKTAFFGGSPATEEMVKGIFNKLPNLNISVGYGLTESFGMVCTTPYEDVFRKIKAAGKLLPMVDAKIVDDEGNELPPESIGEIMLRGVKVFKRYWKNQEETKAAITADGWLHTGDIGKIDDEGFLYILDRKKDMINRGGEKIYSLEVENVINSYPKVLEVAIVGVPDKVMGEAVKAVIALKTGEKGGEEEIKQFCAEHLANYKVPKYVEFVESLPRNPAGKVIKGQLRYVPGK